ncbi:methylenetetrahydrofolate reductase [NAD(P)H] [Malassezia cuniculi]|uniref:Methylenetetrahydrofolate reductase [NAD(P)H] n=1 Tax=Malassezia cuniculi TaxID=948313 RepID=A0AAF0F0S8_9BASI|nr:methylenetetrahydrofolate reductase [NAD(P)H] [Malassezia cuniculi]
MSGSGRIDEKLASLKDDQYSWSLEYFPPKTSEGLANLFPRVQRMVSALSPAWINVTWGAGGSTRESSLELASRIQKGIFDAQDDWRGNGSGGCDVCLHLTCTNVTHESIAAVLEEAKSLGIRNILALRGDPPRGDEYHVESESQLAHATDLVRFIRKLHGDYFCIGVAGYPEGLVDHGESDIERDMANLRAKQEAGAQFIITQLFYDADALIAWYKAIRKHGITLPVVPGIMPIQNYHSLRRMANLCHLRLPPTLLESLENVRLDDALVKDLGVSVSTALVERIRQETDIRAFHFYSLNLEKSVTRVLQQVGAMSETAMSEAWDEFPNGRYGDSRSPAFGEIDGYGASLKLPPADAIRLWGTPVDEDDIGNMFAAYVQGTLSCIPWCDIPVWDETAQLLPSLIRLNSPPSKGGRGWWTVGSQPAVDAASSTDPTFGFGPAGGFIFQKAFVELFISDEDKQRLVERIAKDPSVTYFAGTADPDSFESNVADGGVNTVTWGVFPGYEIAQPTIIEELSFRAWRDEAFAIWREWEQLHHPRSATRQFIRKVHDSRWLVTVVHHDYKDPNALWKLLTE